MGYEFQFGIVELQTSQRNEQEFYYKPKILTEEELIDKEIISFQIAQNKFKEKKVKIIKVGEETLYYSPNSKKKQNIHFYRRWKPLSKSYTKLNNSHLHSYSQLG